MQSATGPRLSGAGYGGGRSRSDGTDPVSDNQFKDNLACIITEILPPPQIMSAIAYCQLHQTGCLQPYCAIPISRSFAQSHRVAVTEPQPLTPCLFIITAYDNFMVNLCFRSLLCLFVIRLGDLCHIVQSTSLPSSGRPPFVFMNPQVVFGALWLVGTGGEKAPDKWAWLASANQNPPLVSRRRGWMCSVTAPLFTEYFGWCEPRSSWKLCSFSAECWKVAFSSLCEVFFKYTRLTDAFKIVAFYILVYIVFFACTCELIFASLWSL